MPWWAISIGGSNDPSGSWRIIQGTPATIKAKYDGAAFGPFSTQQAAQAFANKGGPGPAIPGNPATAIKDLWHGLDFGSWILRLGEIVLGIVLIAVGVSKLTSLDNKIAQTAGKLGKLALV